MATPSKTSNGNAATTLKIVALGIALAPFVTAVAADVLVAHYISATLSPRCISTCPGLEARLVARSPNSYSIELLNNNDTPVIVDTITVWITTIYGGGSVESSSGPYIHDLEVPPHEAVPVPGISLRSAPLGSLRQSVVLTVHLKGNATCIIACRG